jgi:hypothetical protein
VNNQTFVSEVSFASTVVFDEFELGEKSVSVTIVDDAVPELLEAVTIEILSTGVGRVDSKDRVTFEIEGNDAAGGTIGFASVDYSETSQEAIGSSTTISIPVVREGLNMGAAQAQWTIVPLMANSTIADFATTSGTVSFAALEASASISLTLLDDSVPELNESFTLRLSSPQPSAVDISLVKSTMSVFVLPDRQAYGVLQFTEQSRLVLEGDSVQLTLQRTLGNLGAVDVAVRTVPGSATANIDFVAVSRTVSFAAGQRSATVNVSIIDDTSAELTETLSCEIVSVSLADSNAPLPGTPSIGSSRSVAIAINSNDNAAGVFGFQQAFAQVSEDDGVVEFVVVRTAGDLTQVVVPVRPCFLYELL